MKVVVVPPSQSVTLVSRSAAVVSIGYNLIRVSEHKGDFIRPPASRVITASPLLLETILPVVVVGYC